MSNKKEIKKLEAEIASFPKGDKDFRSYKIRREIAKLQAATIADESSPEKPEEIKAEKEVEKEVVEDVKEEEDEKPKKKSSSKKKK